MKQSSVVIVGAGQGGFQLAYSLRSGGFAGGILLVGDEPHHPYQRPPLSKAYLTGKQDRAGLMLRGPQWFRQEAITLLTGTPARSIERDERMVTLTDGSRHPYDHLVIATGARARGLTCPGSDLKGIASMRTLDDADAIRAALDGVRRVVIVGGGFIGLEFAAVASTLGKEVTLVEAQSRLMARAVAPPVSDFFMDAHRAKGVSFRMGTGVSRFLGAHGSVTAVELDDGRVIPADLVIVGIGVHANDRIAAEAGLACQDGIVVDARLRTDDPRIFAIGDCVQHHNPFADRRMRVESVQNAIDQARCAAANILGEDKTYVAVPWFWSDQYDLKLQMVGFGSGYDTIVLRGDVRTRSFSAFYFRDERLIGIDSVNRGADHMLGRRLIAAGRTIPMAAAGDESVELKQFLA